MIGVYGAPPADLAPVPKCAVQTSPLTPGGADLRGIAEGGLDAVTILAPPGTLERQYVLAQALRAVKVGGTLTVLATKAKGGSRLGAALKAFGCDVAEMGKRHHRLCVTQRPATVTGLDQALAAGSPRQIEGLGWSQPGVFSWDRLDPGTTLLLEQLPALGGRGADFGCGVGLLARQVLSAPAVTELNLIDIDSRAIDCARRNIDDTRTRLTWGDVREAALTDLDFVVMNPPFHDGGSEDRTLGQAFIAAASQALRKGGVCWLVANRHLPYEAALAERFAHVRLRHEGRAFKVYEAVV